jgi:hypothetical protein
MCLFNKGQYRYLDPFGNDVEVQYWSDSLGFHQTDNRDLVPVTETAEVRKAREEHARAWKEAARNNGIEVDSNSDDDLEGQLSSHNLVVRPSILPNSKHLSSENAETYASVDDESASVDTNELHPRFARQQDKIEEVTSEPRGFFYSFEYPVRFINDRRARVFGQQHAASDVVKSYAPDDDDSHKVLQTETKRVKQKQPLKSNELINVLEFEEGAHDVQQPPKIKVNRSVKSGRGLTKFKHTI